jgi:putative PIN family toxin of toxin-antitoxin system
VRLVLDTNIAISACMKPDGLEARVMELAMSNSVEVCVTGEILDEYREVLMRDKFLAFRDAAGIFLEAISRIAILVIPAGPVDAASDEDDNRFLECAAAGRADYLITGNLRHFPSAWEGTQIVNARSFFRLTERVTMDAK